MDYDTYSANDAIGKVYLDLNPLLVPPGDRKDCIKYSNYLVIFIVPFFIGLLGRGNVWSEACAVQPPGYILFTKYYKTVIIINDFLFCTRRSNFVWLAPCLRYDAWYARRGVRHSQNGIVF